MTWAITAAEPPKTPPAAKAVAATIVSQEAIQSSSPARLVAFAIPAAQAAAEAVTLQERAAQEPCLQALLASLSAPLAAQNTAAPVVPGRLLTATGPRRGPRRPRAGDPDS